MAEGILAEIEQSRRADLDASFEGVSLDSLRSRAEPTFQSSTIAFLAYDERNHRLVIIERPGTTEAVQNAAGLDHLAFA